jgi:hypothetical protein
LKKNNLVALLLFFLPIVSLAQEGSKVLRFRVTTTDSTSVSGINVVNMFNEKSATSNSVGEFSILVKPGDLLILQKETFEYKRQPIDQDDMSKSVVIIKMTPKPIALDEVVVNQKATPDDLIMRHKDHRKFTPAEKKLYTATTGLLDPLINFMSGRTAQLKHELQIEMKERLLARLDMVYDEQYYVEKLKIPNDYIGDFKRFMIDDEPFVSALKAKNKTLMQFETARLATSYKRLMSAVFNEEK